MNEPKGQVVAENRQEWFCLLVAYMKMKTLVMWLQCHPETSYESFERIWPALLDQMLASATEAACRQLKESHFINNN